ncbi:MAG: hypothetical protein LBO75_05105 [Bifidobacteriaceae bacterium]|nr:hypothetical protein [Bifidobacteriaceae bacterium]
MRGLKLPEAGLGKTGPDRAVTAVGVQAAVGAVLGLVWWWVAPRPLAQWTGQFWYAPTDLGFNAAQDVWFAVLTAVPGLTVGVLLVLWSARPQPLRRFAWWWGGGVVGAGLCALTGSLLGGAFASPPAGSDAAASLTLTSPGLVAAWAFLAALVVMLSLAARGLFGKTW